jgi:hypothetical protein
MNHFVSQTIPSSTIGTNRLKITVGKNLFHLADIMLKDAAALTITFRLFLALLVVGILLLCIDLRCAKVNHEILLRLASTNSGWKEILRFGGCKKMVAASVLAAAAIPLVMEAILHMQNLPVLVMLFVSWLVLCLMLRDGRTLTQLAFGAECR